MHSQKAVFSCFVLCIIFLSASPVRADDPTPMEIFQNHAKAVGYSLSDGRAKPFVIETTTTWYDYKGGRHSSTDVLKQAGTYYREDFTYGGSTDSSGFDGTDFWQSSDNGSLTADSGYNRPFDVTWAVINAEGFDASLPAESRKSPGFAYVVRIHPASGVPADVYFDRTTWLIDQVIIDPDGDSIRQEYADYKQYGPVQVAMTRRVNTSTIRVTKFTWDASVAADDLSAPSNHDFAVSFPASGVVTVPFDPHGGVVVKATINGVEGRFAVETLISGILVDPVMAQKAGLSKSTMDAHFENENPLDTTALPASTVRIGGLTLDKCNVRLVSDNLDFPQQPYDGYLGLDLLAQAVTSINFDTNTLTFTKPGNFSAPHDQLVLPIALDGGVPQLVSVVNGSKKVVMQLGLSVQGTTFFWQIFLKANPDIAYEGGGFSGTMKSFALGPYEQDTVRATSMRFTPGLSFETGANGIIGEGVLNAFNIILDYPDSKLFLAPTKRTAP
jgi:aspartyl protease